MKTHEAHASTLSKRSKEFTRSKPGDAGITSVSWFALWQVRPGMDDPELSALFSKAESDPSPEFRISSDPASPRRTVDAVRALVDVQRALGVPGAKKVEIEIIEGRATRSALEREAGKEESLDAMLTDSDYQTVTVNRFAGRNTHVRIRTPRPFK